MAQSSAKASTAKTKKKKTLTPLARASKTLYYLLITFVFSMVVWMGYELISTATKAYNDNQERLEEKRKEKQEREAKVLKPAPSEEDNKKHD
jgi:cell division protein FtsL